VANEWILLEITGLNHWHDTLEQAWATFGPRATYGPPSTLMWPASYIWSFLNRYFDYENTLNIKKVPVFLQKKQHSNQFIWTWTGPRIPNLSLMWPAKPKELPTPALESRIYFLFWKVWELIMVHFITFDQSSWANFFQVRRRG